MSDKQKILTKTTVATFFAIGIFVLAYFLGESGTEEVYGGIIIFATIVTTVAALADAFAFAIAGIALMGIAFVADVATDVSGVAGTATDDAFGLTVVVAGIAVIVAGATVVFAVADIDKRDRKFAAVCYVAEFISIAGIISAIIFL